MLVGKMHREGSCSKAAGGPAESCLGGGGLFPSFQARAAAIIGAGKVHACGFELGNP